MSGSSSKSRTRSIRIPLAVDAEIRAYAERHDMTYNEVVIARCVALRDRRYSAPVDVRQESIFDALAEARAAEAGVVPVDDGGGQSAS